MSLASMTHCPQCGGALDTGMNCVRGCGWSRYAPPTPPITLKHFSAVVELSDREYRSLQRTAEYRAEVGRLRRILLDLRDQCAPGSVASSLIEQGLEGRAE